MANGREYQNFDIIIEKAGDKYRARVINSPSGQAKVEFEKPFSELELENFILRMGRPRSGMRRLDSPEMETVKVFGTRLFQTVINDDVYACYLRSLDNVLNQGSGLRIRLHINVPEFHNLPWEYLYNPQVDQFLALSKDTPIIRYLELPYTTQALPVDPPLKILVMISSPDGYLPLNVEEEWKRLNKALQPLSNYGLVSLEKLEYPTLSALQQKLRKDQIHIFHYIGHGKYFEQKQDGLLLLEDENHRGTPVSGQHLGAILHDHHSLRLVVLNACEGARTSSEDLYAGVAQTLVRQGIPAVLAMQFEIFEDAATTFAQEFYSAIVDNYPVDAALSEARKAIFASNNDVEWGTPVLFMRTPDGTLFRPENTEERATRLEAEKIRQERIKKEIEEKIARQKADREIAEKAAKEEAEQERKERERLAREEKARKEKEATEKIAKEKAQKEQEAGELHYRGMLAHKQGKFDEAEQWFQKSLKIAIDLNDEQAKANLLNQLAILTQDRKTKEKTEREAAEKKAAEKAAREEAEKKASALQYRGMLAQKEGNYDEAERLFRQSLEIAIQLKDEQGKANILHQLAVLTQDRLAREKAEREDAEKAAKEKAEREATEKAAREKAKREAADRRAANERRIAVNNVEKIGQIKSIDIGDDGHTLCYSHDGTLIAVGSSSGKVVSIRTKDFAISTLSENKRGFWKGLLEFGNVGLAFAPKSNLLAYGSPDKSILFFFGGPDDTSKVMMKHDSVINSLAFSPDGSMLASGSDDLTIRLWRVSDGNLINTLNAPTLVLGVNFSPDGTTLASSLYDKRIFLWRVSDGKLIKELQGHKKNIRNVAFSPDGTILASGSADKTIGLWHVNDGKLIEMLEGHKKEVRSVAFSPDGTILASSSFDNTIGLWDIKNRKLIKVLDGHSLYVYGVAFSPDGTYLASSSTDGTVKLWAVKS